MGYGADDPSEWILVFLDSLDKISPDPASPSKSWINLLLNNCVGRNRPIQASLLLWSLVLARVLHLFSGLSVGDEFISRTNRCLLSVYLTLSSQPGNLLPLSVSLLPQISLSLLAHQVLSSPSCDKHDKREARQISQLKSSLNLSSPRIVSSKCKTK